MLPHGRQIDSRRRRILKAGMGAGTLFAMPRLGWTQTSLLSAPKLALVMGNSRYKESPLTNPANDARAIGETLKAMGFSVTSKLDAGRAEMDDAIKAYIAELAAKKGVGLFYFAGHGLQLAWRNYMLPVDADIDKVTDIPKQSVELNNLLEGIGKAGNPLNVIVLDACRDNPFGGLKGLDHKGLSQMDAPTHTLLAYATSPGNTASDGVGANGLYTEHFLREMKVPEAKLEDVFKRVRLGVRRGSKGLQVPWESTSLEDDFWFIPPAQLKKQSEEEKTALFRQELALWEKIQDSTEPGPFEDYLRRHPSGQYAELAQLQLDRVLAKQGEKKVQIASAEGNPFTKGSATASTGQTVGDSYSYRELDIFSKAEQRQFTNTITQVTESEVVYGSGLVTDLLGNARRLANGNRLSPNQNYPFEFAVGRHWESRFIIYAPKGELDTVLNMRIVGREIIKVPAGEFNAFRVEWTGSSRIPGIGSQRIEGRAW